ncbi:IS3 family transposase [Salidesulfovibrio brasiliensis]|uniref:IS3 family transposase n=1 Tax=Salidesulfovibrio brasiliensis TaxID=221711 RepID=UPI0009F9667C
MRICKIATPRVRYDYGRIQTLLCREDWEIDHKQVYRLYKEEGLLLRNKRPKPIVSAATVKKQKAQHCSMNCGLWAS